MKLDEVVGGPPPEKAGNPNSAGGQPQIGEPMGNPDASPGDMIAQQREQKKQIQNQIKAKQQEIKMLQQQLRTL